jgi:uncharacterized protein
MEEKTEKKKKGFAVMSPDLVSKIASKGGIASHAKGTAHKYTSEEARAAALKSLAAKKAKKGAKNAP